MRSRTRRIRLQPYSRLHGRLERLREDGSGDAGIPVSARGGDARFGRFGQSVQNLHELEMGIPGPSVTGGRRNRLREDPSHSRRTTLMEFPRLPNAIADTGHGRSRPAAAPRWRRDALGFERSRDITE